MAGTRERIFAGFGAGLFLLLAAGSTVFIIYQANSASNSSTANNSRQTCSDNQTEVALKTPAVYVAPEPVTELKKTDLQAGSGAAAKAGDCLVVKYFGTLASNGTKFDENYTSTQGFAFRLGRSQVIPGWDQGLVGMKAGGERQLVIPAALAYGSQAQGSIPANSDLVFVVKLLRIQN